MKIPDATNNELIEINPNFDKRSKAYLLFKDVARRLSSLEVCDEIGRWVDSIESIRKENLNRATDFLNSKDAIVLKAIVSALCDLRAQDWRITIEGRSVFLMRPLPDAASSVREKERVRRGLLIEKEMELRSDNVRNFILDMEKQRWYRDKWVSIFSLMRDGHSLSSKIKQIVDGQSDRYSITKFDAVISPYIQFVDPESNCEFTGLRLVDIWRYFRYTWSSVYKSTPGRTIQILIRDSAAANHPIIGIAALSSAVAQQTVRDNWIGWTPTAYFQKLDSHFSDQEAKWVLNSLDELLRSIYVKDFLQNKIIARKEIKFPTQEAISRLTEFSEKSKKNHYLYPQRIEEQERRSATIAPKQFWRERAEMPLFASKRASQLCRLLEARLTLNRLNFKNTSEDERLKLLKTISMKKALSIILREVKASHIGIDMMAINVCGSVAPYNALLGGKLVAMMMASSEVIEECKRKYDKAESVIASAMSGRPVIRRPRLVLLETTSLYGVASSQYNRLKIPVREITGNGEDMLEFLEFDERTEGYGSFHFSKQTVEALNELQAQSHDFRKVNSIFGEGVSPRLRKIRAGLTLAGLPSADLLLHGSKRIVYALVLAKNFRQVLLNKAERPKYILPQKKSKEVSKKISQYWIKRWLMMRVKNETVLGEIEKDTLDYPIKHRARVLLPDTAPNESLQEELFQL